jgi:hypothetical protein
MANAMNVNISTISVIFNQNGGTAEIHFIFEPDAIPNEQQISFFNYNVEQIAELQDHVILGTGKCFFCFLAMILHTSLGNNS